jgi:phage terminase Nu1 subunit (DNA packaging protein)
MTDAVTTAALADLFGITDRSIRDLAKRGIITRKGRGFALTESVRGYCEHLRKLATGRGGETAIASATADRARLARAQAELVETKQRKLAGTLVDAAEVESTWNGVLRTVGAGCLAIPSRCAQRLPHLTSHDVTEIDAEVRAALIEAGSEGQRNA